MQTAVILRGRGRRLGEIFALALLASLLVETQHGVRQGSLFAEQPASAEAEPAPMEKSAHGGTILITKENTGFYRPRTTPRLKETIAGIFERTNAFRKEEQFSPLTQSEILQKTAQEFADYMARTGKYGHEADDRTPVDRVKANKYEFCYVGENIAMQFRSDGFATGPLVKAFFQGWKNSPPHRENMLHPDVTETGIGIAQSSETGAFFAVQLVGRPLSAGCKPATPVSSESGVPRTP